nr:MAG TPA: hypothetical protein [Caudoviricetes sp.]
MSILRKVVNGLFFVREQEGEDNPSGPSWKYRRTLIYGGYRLGVGMVLFGALTFIWDRDVSIQMVIGGVALISIILTAYTATATFEDVKIWKQQETENSEGE